MAECAGRLGKWFGHRFQVEVIANSTDHVVDLACTRCGRRMYGGDPGTKPTHGGFHKHGNQWFLWAVPLKRCVPYHWDPKRGDFMPSPSTPDPTL